MQKIGNSTDTATQDGEFTNGDPQTQKPCTLVTAQWLNTLQREVVHLCDEAGIELDPNDDTQVYQAIQALMNTDVDGMVKSVNTKEPDAGGNVTLVAQDIGAYPLKASLTVNDSPNTLHGTTMLGYYGVPGAATATKAYPIDGFLGTIFVMTGSNGTQQVAFNCNGRQFTRTLTAAWNGTDGPWSAWFESYSENHKPTAAESGALPLHPKALAVDLNTLGASTSAGVYCQPANAGATPANHYPLAEAGTVTVTPSAYGCQQEYTTFGTGRKLVRGLTAAWNGTDGPWGAWQEFYGVNYPGEIISQSPNSFRMLNGDRGTFWRLDGSNLYLMKTASGDQFGSYDETRPIRLDLATGLVYINDAQPYSQNNCPFPVGYLMLMGNNTDPNELYPGTTWQFLNGTGYDGRVIALGQDPLGTGGSNTVTLAEAHLPAHRHKGGSTGDAGIKPDDGATQWGTGRFGTDNKGNEPLMETSATGGGQAFSVQNEFVHFQGWMRTA